MCQKVVKSIQTIQFLWYEHPRHPKRRAFFHFKFLSQNSVHTRTLKQLLRHLCVRPCSYRTILVTVHSIDFYISNQLLTLFAGRGRGVSSRSTKTCLLGNELENAHKKYTKINYTNVAVTYSVKKRYLLLLFTFMIVSVTSYI